MIHVKSEMTEMKSGNLMEPGTPGGTVDINTKDRQEPATAAEKTNVNSEMANVQSDGHLEAKKPADTANVNTKDRQEFATAAEMANIKSEIANIKSAMAMSQSSNDATQSSKGRRTPEVIVLSSDPTESMATTQSTNAAIRSGTTLPIPAVIVLSSDPTDSPTSAPNGTENRTIEVIELSSDPPEGASSTPSTSHNSKRFRANSPDSASKRPHGSPAVNAKLQKKAGPS
ncbi:hypothetical protein KC345_g687 [Hortaea werneckii]|nr:hypothetical protein KC345_g687 [Hortaea werneckii]